MRKIVCIIMAICLCGAASAQKADFRKGNRQFKKGDYGQADISYRKGLLKDSTSVKGRYNLANNLYRQQNFDEAATQMDAIPVDSLNVKEFDADVLFNKGDIAIARQDWQTAVNCFIQYLMVHPEDIAAKENYTYARYHLQNHDQNQNQDQNNQDQNQDQPQDQKDQPQDQDQDQNQDQNQDQQRQPQKPQEQPVQLSPQQAQQMLQAIQDKEKQTQEKVDEKKAQALKSRQKEKNW